jgi:hypothetical protein
LEERGVDQEAYLAPLIDPFTFLRSEFCHMGAEKYSLAVFKKKKEEEGKERGERDGGKEKW